MIKKQWKKRNRWKAILLAGILAILAAACSQEKAEGELQVHFLDVGQGLAVLVESEGEAMLYDGGDRDKSSFVVSYLKEQGIDQLTYVMASHYDADHLSGVIGAVEAFPVEHIIGPDYEHDSKLYQSFVTRVKEHGKTVEHPETGEQYSLGSATVTVLAPKEIGKDANENSLVVRITNGRDSFLLTGDAEHKSEEAMCESGMKLESTVLSLGHHGSANSTSWEFLQKVVPEYAVISCGTGNSYGHPAADTMEKLESMEVQILRTDKQGTIVAATDGEGIRWNVEPCYDYTPGDPEDQGTVPAGEEPSTEERVWISGSGKKYHKVPDCGGMNPDSATRITQAEAEERGLEPCKNCYE